MVWWTRLADTGQRNATLIFEEEGLLDEYGPLLRSIRVPATSRGRVLALLTAIADGDADRKQAVLDAAQTPSERQSLADLVSPPTKSESTETPVTDVGPAGFDVVVRAYAAGQFATVIDAFISDPRVEHAELAVAAVLDSDAMDQADRVLSLVMEIESRGVLNLSRRGRADLESLKRVASDACWSWVEWASRLASQTRWPDASSVARDQGGMWEPIARLDADAVNQLADYLLEAPEGVNANQLRFSLDLLCTQATVILREGVANEYCHTVLILLSEEDNLSEPVRYAYADLFEAWLAAGPSESDYREVLNEARGVWNRIASRVALPWAITVLYALADAPCPDNASRTAFAAHLVAGARKHYARVGLRERVEVEFLADELGVGAIDIEIPQAEHDVWSTLDGRIVGIYSLLPRVVSSLRSRLERLCSVGEVRGNHDKVATPALTNLAQRADYLIVDTWHATHQATAAIDAVRAKDRQILPSQRGLSGFLRALEDALAIEGNE